MDSYDKTSTPRFMWGIDAIPAKVMEEFMSGYGKTFDLLNKKDISEAIKEPNYDFFTKTKDKIKADDVESRVEREELPQVEIDRLFDVDQLGKAEVKGGGDVTGLPADMPRVFKEIKQTLKELPDGATLRMEDLYTVMKNIQQSENTSIKSATIDDIRNFNRFLKDIKDQTSDTHKWWYSFLFPDTLGAKMAGHDLNMLYKMQLPASTKDGKGLANIKVPISTMSYLNKSGGLVRELEDSIKNGMVEELFDAMKVKSEIESLDDGITVFTDLFMLAQKRMNANRESTQSKDFYLKEFADSKDLYDSYKDRVFKITRNGKLVERTGEQLMDDITNQQGRFFTNFYQRFLKSGVVDKDGNWNAIDWRRIDEKIEYAKNGLVLHDFVRYNKYGRFDLQRFERLVMQNVETFGTNKMQKLIGKRTNPLTVELLNRVQEEMALESILTSRGIKNPDSAEAMAVRIEWRQANKFKGIGFQGGQDVYGDRVAEYFPQMMHDRKKLKPWMQDQMVTLKKNLNNYVNDLILKGSRSATKETSIGNRYRFTPWEEKALLGKIPAKTLRNLGLPENSRALADEFIAQKLELQRSRFESTVSERLGEAVMSDYAIEWMTTNWKNKQNRWEDLGANMRPATGQSRGEQTMPHFSYGFEVLEAYTNQWVGALFKNINALNFKKAIDNYAENSVYRKSDPHLTDMWVLEMQKYASSLMGRANHIPKKYTGMTGIEISKAKNDIKRGINIEENKLKLANDKKLKRKNNITAPWYNPLRNLDYRLSDQNMIDYLDTKSQGFNSWLGSKLNIVGDEKSPKILGVELPRTPEARRKVLMNMINNVGAFESKMSLITLLAHPKTYLGNILGGSQNTITNMGMRNFIRARDTKYLIQNVFAGAKLKDGTPITDRNTLHRHVAEIGALESFYIDEAMQDRRLNAKKMIPFIKEVLSKGDGATDASIKDLAKKYQVEDSVMSMGGFFMRKSERTLRTDAYLAHYLNAREYLSKFIPDMPHDHPYLIGMALKGVEATQFLYHNLNRPSISRSAMGKVLTRFQPFVWNSLRFRRDIFKQQKLYGFNDPTFNKRAERLMTYDLMAMAFASVFAGSIFDSILPPPMNYIQDTAEWLFGDERTAERAFFSSYPSTALAPLQTITAPVHRYYLPFMTALINGEWERFTDYYIHTLYPFGRLARSTVMTFEKPELFAEFMFGIPVHKLGKIVRKKPEDE